MEKLYIILPIALILCFMVGCQDKEANVERIMEDGIEVIVNHLEPYKIRGEPSNLILEEVFIIDLEKEDLAEIGLTDIRNFDVDSEGNIFILGHQADGDSIFKFDQKGNFATSFGRIGGGPGEIGEMRGAFYLRVINEDDVMVVDAMRKIIIFNNDGSFKKEVSLNPNITQALPLENGNYLVKKSGIIDPESNHMERPFLLCNPQFEEIKELDRLRRPTFAAVRLGFPRLRFVHCVSEGLIYVGNTQKGYEIRIYDLEGNLKRKIRKEFQPVEVSEEMKKEVLKQFEDPRAAEIRKKIFFHDNCPPFQYLFTDDEGYLFIMTHEEGENPREYVYDVFSPEGIFISRTSLGNLCFATNTDIQFVTAKNHLLYSLNEKENGYKELVVYKMIWEEKGGIQ